MLSVEVATFYGIKEQALCTDFVGFLNGMLGFAEPNRRVCWEQICAGLVRIQTIATEAETKYAELEAKFGGLSKKNEEISLALKGSLELSERLNESNKEYMGQVETLKAELALLVDTSKRQVPDPAQRVDKAKGKRTSREQSPAGNESEEPPPKKDKSDLIVSLRGKITSLIAENERLDGLVKALSHFEIPPETGRVKVSAEEMAKLRKTNSTLMAQLESTAEEARRMAHKYSDYIKDNDEQWEKERLGWKKQVDELKKGQPVAPPTILVPAALVLSNGTPMACPVPIRTGRMMPLIEIYCYWKRFPSENEGTFFASFPCPFTGQCTSLASIEQINLIRGMTVDLQLFVLPPLRFQHFCNGNWIDFSFVDQITIASMCCKLYRLETTRCVENVLVCHGDFIFKIHVTDGVVDFQMQPVHNMPKLSPACLLEGIPGFFQRWSFPNGGDVNVPGDQ